jgi:hypothetical protein
MRNFSYDNYEPKLIRQMIHLDQGLAFNPEFRSSRAMKDYPSRKFQLAFSANKNFIKKSEEISNVLFCSILSRQGERWQNFGEDPEDLTDVMLLCRESFVKDGFGKNIIKDFKETLNKNNGHIFPVNGDALDLFKNAVETDKNSSTYLALDDATCNFCGDSASGLASGLKSKGVSVMDKIEPVFFGWEYFVYGLIDEGIEYLSKLMKNLKDGGVKKIITLSGQTHYLFTVFAKKLSVEVPFEVDFILNEFKDFDIDVPSYFYAGSFLLRYLLLGDKLNSLSANAREIPAPDCPEFFPLLDADKRVNVLNIWQKPLTAEYSLFGFPEDIKKDILKDALEDIERSGAEQIIVFEPYSFDLLKKMAPRKKVIYFLSLV